MPKTAKPAAKAKAKPADAPKVPAKPITKQQTIIELLKREGGATVAEIMAATEWQPHSVRGGSGVSSRSLTDLARP